MVVSPLPFIAVIITATMYNYWRNLHTMLMCTTAAHLMLLYVAVYCAKLGHFDLLLMQQSGATQLVAVWCTYLAVTAPLCLLATSNLRSALFWHFTQHIIVVLCRRFGIIHLSLLEGSSSPRRICCDCSDQNYTTAGA